MRRPASRIRRHDVEVQFGANPLGHQRVLDKADQLELHRPVAELAEQGQRRGDRQHRVLRLGGGDQQLPHLFGVALVGGVDATTMRATRSACIQFFTAPVIRVEFGTISVARSKVSISVARALMRRTKPWSGADDDPVADADAALPQQDQAGNEIVGDALQAEADADREAAGDPGEPVGVEAEPRARRDQQRDHDADIAEDRADRVLDAGVEPGARQIAVAEPVLRGARRHQDEEEHASAAPTATRATASRRRR